MHYYIVHSVWWTIFLCISSVLLLYLCLYYYLLLLHTLVLFCTVRYVGSPHSVSPMHAISCHGEQATHRNMATCLWTYLPFYYLLLVAELYLGLPCLHLYTIAPIATCPLPTGEEPYLPCLPALPAFTAWGLWTVLLCSCTICRTFCIIVHRACILETCLLPPPHIPFLPVHYTRPSIPSTILTV